MWPHREASAHWGGGTSVLGLAKNSRGIRTGTAGGRLARGGWEGNGQPRTAVNGAGAPTLFPAAQPASAQLTGYFFPCLTKYGQGAQPEGGHLAGPRVWDVWRGI